MKKSTMLSDFFFSSLKVFIVKNVPVNAQNKIDEKRNVKQPPELLLLNKVIKYVIPALAKFFQKAFLHRKFSSDYHLYSQVPI
ncbi:hypothetical protein ULMS_03080 [Patiriisocius marinistellae]|uniref:Uncharacterized protein n=1 Tax=Patiriisocius marinistellae TaxID=2494560 RepID=A0A5J4FTA3_9FLAO|nr:hypothetical protein [Patiriisocius marinistellae]GEQ84800.1 hypothetical protein ULMS_03080 [Patiriisocius marinistellae]